jgi:RNA polymerase I-specific transcription initiation factor RRN3
MTLFHCFSLQVEIKLDELPDDDVETKEPEIFDVELEEKQAEIEEMANKLDVMMDIFLDYLNKRPASEIDEIYNILMKCFDQIIIQTHKSKYTQFILFFLCNMKSSYCEHFLNYLCNKMASSNETLHIRQICAAYIGNFFLSFIRGSNKHRMLSLERISEKIKEQRKCFLLLFLFFFF